MAFRTILHDLNASGVVTLTLNRPDKGNAVSEAMAEELLAAARDAGRDPAVRAVVLTGAGRSFCTGGDLEWFMKSFDDTRDGRISRSAVFSDLYETLDTLPKPLIGRINGSAYGAGTGLIAVCDVAFALTSSRFGFSETRIGLIPASFAPYVIPRIGVGNARKVMVSGAPFPAATAVRIGLLEDTCTDATELDVRIAEAIADYLAAAPGAIALAKKMVTSFVNCPPETMREYLSSLIGDAWETGEARARLAKLLGNR